MILEARPFESHITIRFRLATREDLPRLEWYGQYTHFRRVFQKTYLDQLNGKRLMILADLNGFPIGQVFLLLETSPRLARQRRKSVSEEVGYLYSLRVMEHLRGMGIGTRLIDIAEAVLTERGYKWILISVAKTNTGALRLYKRLGYRIYQEDEGRWRYVNHKGQTVHVHEPCYMLEKRLDNL